VQAELAHLGEHLAEGFSRAGMTGEILEVIAAEVVGLAGRMVCPGSRESGLFKASHDQGAKELLGLVVTIAQVDQQYLALIHDLTNVEVVLLLPQHVEDAGVVGQGADLVGGAAHHAGALPAPAVELVGEEGLAISGDLGIGDLQKLLAAEVIVGEQAVEIAQGFFGFDQGGQGGAHYLLEARGF